MYTHVYQIDITVVSMKFAEMANHLIF